MWSRVIKRSNYIVMDQRFHEELYLNYLFLNSRTSMTNMNDCIDYMRIKQCFEEIIMNKLITNFKHTKHANINYTEPHEPQTNKSITTILKP